MSKPYLKPQQKMFVFCTLLIINGIYLTQFSKGIVLKIGETSRRVVGVNISEHRKLSMLLTLKVTETLDGLSKACLVLIYNKVF